ncbi:peptidoglycan-binding protein [Streptomyces sp. NPDC006270]|uniref:peptidoglycan-binding domain-containing protein n=1 Tax=Streptomyces sp. NPDC006270 TaxID=3364741 RepID=UPI0036C0DF47
MSVNRSWVRTVTTLAVLATAGCAGAGAGSGPAAGSGGTPAKAADPPVDRVYVSGSGDPADDWRDEGMLGEDLPLRSDLAALWQTVLWADGYLGRADIDCRFAGETPRATRVWQSNRKLGADGIVGPLTLARAGERLVEREGEVFYRGAEHTVSFRRAPDGRYLVEDDGSYKPLRRDRATLTVCEAGER